MTANGRTKEQQREYMREYRARTGGTTMADKANNKAIAALVKLTREECPDLWRDLLRDARISLGLSVEEGPGGQFTYPREHGTMRGYSQHYHRGEPVCDRCRAGMSRYMAQYHRNRKAARS